jgi:hypothetical protein
MTDTELLVYVDLEGQAQLVGCLWARVRKGREGATFEYDRFWLKIGRARAGVRARRLIEAWVGEADWEFG